MAIFGFVVINGDDLCRGTTWARAFYHRFGMKEAGFYFAQKMKFLPINVKHFFTFPGHYYTQKKTGFVK
jgi:hypothetical protein